MTESPPISPLRPDETWQFPVDDCLVLARPETHGVFLLNSTARIIWAEFAGSSSPEVAAGVVAATFGIPYDQAIADVATCYQMWSTAPVEHANQPAHSPFPPPAKPKFSEVRDCAIGGIHFRVCLETPELTEEISPRLSPFVCASGNPEFTLALRCNDNSVLIWCDDKVVSCEESVAAARAILLQEITRRTRTDRDVKAILHAGACANESGCLLLAGPSHSGKSTLSVALMDRGLVYYADDSILLDSAYCVVPMPFPIMLREPSWRFVAERRPGLSDIPVRTRWGVRVRFVPATQSAETAVPRPATALVFLNYEPSARTSIKPITVFDSLVLLKQSGFWIEHTCQDIQAFIEWLTAIPRYHLTHSDLEESVTVLLRLIES